MWNKKSWTKWTPWGRAKRNNRFFLQLKNPIQPLMIFFFFLLFVFKMICSQSLNAWTHYLPVSNLSSLCILNHSNCPCPNHNLYQLLWTHQPPHKSLLSPVLNYSISRLSINPLQSSLFPDPSLPVFLLSILHFLFIYLKQIPFLHLISHLSSPFLKTNLYLMWGAEST